MELNKHQKEAIECIDHNLQIVACAGSGKTEVISRRIVNILLSRNDVKPENIVAFTFTEKAAANMRKRIEGVISSKGLDVNTEGMFIGTIHSFCRYVLNQFSEEYKDVQILDTVKEHLFISKHVKECGAATLGLSKSLRDAALFSECVDKMIYYAGIMDKWPDKCKQSFNQYRSKLKEQGFINFSFLIYELIDKIETSIDIKEYMKTIKYLVVDEYQDVDDLQEKLISRISDFGAKVCVVGDDDQTIYQFRGSNANNMIGFSKRYSDVVTKHLDINYRSDRAIIDIADTVIKNNSNRLEKIMKASSGEQGKVDGFIAANEEEEYSEICQKIVEIHKRGVPYSDIAVLIRGRSRLQTLIQFFKEFNIPFHADLADDFFTSKYYEDFCILFEYLIDPGQETKKKLIERWQGLVGKEDLTKAFKSIRKSGEQNESFSTIFLRFIGSSGFKNYKNEKYINAFDKILKDFDSIFIRDSWYVRTDNLRNFLSHESGAKYEYRYSELIDDNLDESVNIMTVHKSKGLEYGVVIIPDLQDGFFPPSKPGGRKYYNVLGGIFEENKEKYETALEDERKLFYVAVTRAKNELYLYANTEKKDVSDFLIEATESQYLDIPLTGETKEMNSNYDIKAIKREILEDLYAAAHVAHFGAAYGEADDIRRASDEEILQIAREKRINIEQYKKRSDY